MSVFPLLANEGRYRACDTDLLLNHEAREHWLNLFATHFDVLLSAAGSTGIEQPARDAARTSFLSIIDQLRQQPDLYEQLNILLLDELRQDVLNAHGITDEFRLIKERENELALRVLPHHLQWLDAHAPSERLYAIVRGMLAGNLFDMGVQETAARFTREPFSFAQALTELRERPWLHDDLDQAEHDWNAQPVRKAILFADNAGADVVLGLLPLAREIVRRGGRVVIAANERPSLNDVTHIELRQLLAEAAAVDDVFGSDAIQVVSSGGTAPLLDMRRVSSELIDQAPGTDLIVLVGMGRSIESNFSARFTCRCWKVAMIKDPQVARSLNCRMYDPVFRYHPPCKAAGQLG